MAFGPERLVEWAAGEAEPAAATGCPVLWIDSTGLGDVEAIEKLGRRFLVHHLALEDVVNVDQRAKAERFGDTMFVVARVPIPGVGRAAGSEQYTLCFGRGWVATFQEYPGDCFEPIRERIRAGRPRIRGSGADYLAYALLDAIIDSYFPIIEAIGDRLAALEHDVITRPRKDTAVHILEAKHELTALRRAVWPHRDAVRTLLSEGGDLLADETRLHLRDCQDHVAQIIDLVDQHRDLCTDLMSVYLSTVSNRMNEVMKVLTVIATIFIPLGFIAGVYGMNFDPSRSRWNMPELGWALGYPFALALMLVVALALVGFFWRKGWLGGG